MINDHFGTQPCGDVFMTTHQEIDQRSLALHRLVAEKIRHDPLLLMRAQQTLSRWRQSASPRVLDYLDQWQQLLDRGVDECLAVALDDAQYAAALRQSSPLACLLSPQERYAFLKQWRANHAAS